MLVNGILHDIFVLQSEHGKVYDRNLLRLLTDGHVLITCGVILLLCYKGIKLNQPWAYYISFTVCMSILIYCGMIFPFLKSIGTITISLVLLVSLIINYLKL